jgi:hypothetical protein
MFVLPYLGATKKMIAKAAARQTLPNARNQGARKYFLNSIIVVTACSSGALIAMMMDPSMHWKHPIQPNSYRPT